MAKKPKATSGSRVSNIIAAMRGDFDFKALTAEDRPAAFGSAELINNEMRHKILSGATRAAETGHNARPTAQGMMGLVQSSLTRSGQERLENRKILQLLPEVAKAARLMTASTFSPNDLSLNEISIHFASDDIPDTYTKRLGDYATTFFEKKLNLSTSAFEWVMEYGYESGSAVFAIVPLRSFEKIQDDSYLGIEAFIDRVVEPLSHESLFGFATSSNTEMAADSVALEALVDTAVFDSLSVMNATSNRTKEVLGKPVASKLIESFIGKEALSLTDNPDILQAGTQARKKIEQRSKSVIGNRYLRPMAESIVGIDAELDPKDKKAVIGDPILMRLPSESVTVIHTPGDPNDHQGYLILLDRAGNPINAVGIEEAQRSTAVDYNQNQGNIFNQVYNAYGVSSSSRGSIHEDTMGKVYTQIVTEHLKNRVGKAGFTNSEIGNCDAMMRCMFSRFMQSKQTRILFMPKELVSYMAFELDQNGYGVSRLDGIKFNLGLKMAIQVSRVLASIKSAMDRRKIEVKFTENMMDDPEAILGSVIRQYIDKSTMSFSIDPNVIQGQIADKSISIAGIDIPGMENFSLTNEPDQRSGSFDFDPSISEGIDKAIMNGMHVPPATMNSLGEDEYARSVSTTNLFFSMDVKTDQKKVIKNKSDLIRKYGRYSEPFRRGLLELFPNLNGANKTKSISSTEDDIGDGKSQDSLPGHYTLDSLIDTMHITLPVPNIAPSKAQFEQLEAMVTALTNTFNALFPDDLIGADDTLAPALRLLRSRLITQNIRNYLDGSGMSTLDVPDTNFSSVLGDLNNLQDALGNIAGLLKDKAALNAPPLPEGMDAFGATPGADDGFGGGTPVSTPAPEGETPEPDEEDE